MARRLTGPFLILSALIAQGMFPRDVDPAVAGDTQSSGVAPKAWKGSIAMPDEAFEVMGHRHYVPAPGTISSQGNEGRSVIHVTLPVIGGVDISTGETPVRDPNTGASLRPFGEAYENSSPVSHGLAQPGQSVGTSHY